MPRRRIESLVPSTPVALVYIRVSTQEQAENGTSLDAQTRECRRYISYKGWTLGDEFCDVLSGKRDDRPAYQKLLVQVRELRAAHQPAMLVVADFDRLGRDLQERVRVWKEIVEGLSVELHSVRHGGVVPRMVYDVLAAVAAEESNKIKTRITNGWKNLSDQGWFKTSSKLPWGYMSRLATKGEREDGKSPKHVLAIDETQAAYVRMLFERASAGESTRSLAAWAASLPSEARGRWDGRDGKTERTFTTRTIAYVLRNDVYVAKPPAKWPAVVDRATWDAVQAHLDERERAPRSTPVLYPLTGWLHCPDCGNRMNGERIEGGRRRYRCDGAKRGGNTRRCSATATAQQIERAVFAQVAERIHVFVDTNRAQIDRHWMRVQQAQEQPEIAREIARLQRRIETALRRRNDALKLLLDHQIDKPAYDVLAKTETEEEEAASVELTRLQGQQRDEPLPSLSQVLDEVGGWAAALDSGDVQATRRVLRELVQHVVPERLSWGKYTAAIAWTELGSALSFQEVGG